MMMCKYKTDYCDIIGQNVEYQPLSCYFVWGILFMMNIWIHLMALLICTVA